MLVLVLHAWWCLQEIPWTCSMKLKNWIPEDGYYTIMACFQNQLISVQSICSYWITRREPWSPCILNWVFFFFFCRLGIATMHETDCKNWQSNWQNNAFILIWKQGWDSWKQYFSRLKKSILLLECIHFPHGIIMFLVTKFKPKTLKSTSKCKAISGT